MRSPCHTTEERNEGKLSRSVLETSGTGDSLAEFNRMQSMPDDYWSSSTRTWPTPAPKKNDCEPVLGYYKYTLVEYPGESSVRGGKLFWLMVIAAAVWFWFFR
jgi:hypothetical protein